MDIDQRWLTEVGIDAQTGIGYTGSEEKFVSALQRYCKNYEKNSAKVDEFFNANDMENFMITVHALKSNSKMIGAGPLSIEFEKLETAAREGNTALIISNTHPTLSAYKELVEKLSPIMNMGDVKPVNEITAEEARKTAEALFAALDDFDDDLSKTLAKKLSGYPFRMTQADRLKEAIALIDDFMYDEAAAIVKEIYPTIE